jgi:hypothetical protein
VGRFIWAFEWVRGTWRDPRQHFQKRLVRSCPCCGFRGYFVSAKRRGPREFRCPACASRPRDRQIGLIRERLGLPLEGKDILHFAPEWWLFRRLKHEPGYVGGDVQWRPNANAHVDITRIEFPNACFDLLICNHVLEHVPDDRRAMDECYRVLRDDGIAIFTIPVRYDRPRTWEPPPDMPKEEVERICGWDHKRNYGMDFADRLRGAGFDVRVVVFGPDTREEHRLIDEPVFLAARQSGMLDMDAAQLSEYRSG